MISDDVLYDNRNLVILHNEYPQWSYPFPDVKIKTIKRLDICVSKSVFVLTANGNVFKIDENKPYEIIMRDCYKIDRVCKTIWAFTSGRIVKLEGVSFIKTINIANCKKLRYNHYKQVFIALNYDGELFEIKNERTFGSHKITRFTYNIKSDINSRINHGIKHKVTREITHVIDFNIYDEYIYILSFDTNKYIVILPGQKIEISCQHCMHSHVSVYSKISRNDNKLYLHGDGIVALLAKRNTWTNGWSYLSIPRILDYHKLSTWKDDIVLKISSNKLCLNREEFNASGIFITDTAKYLVGPTGWISMINDNKTISETDATCSTQCYNSRTTHIVIDSEDDELECFSRDYMTYIITPTNLSIPINNMIFLNSMKQYDATSDTIFDFYDNQLINIQNPVIDDPSGNFTYPKQFNDVSTDVISTDVITRDISTENVYTTEMELFKDFSVDSDAFELVTRARRETQAGRKIGKCKKIHI